MSIWWMALRDFKNGYKRPTPKTVKISYLNKNSLNYKSVHLNVSMCSTKPVKNSIRINKHSKRPSNHVTTSLTSRTSLSSSANSKNNISFWENARDFWRRLGDMVLLALTMLIMHKPQLFTKRKEIGKRISWLKKQKLTINVVKVSFIYDKVIF